MLLKPAYGDALRCRPTVIRDGNQISYRNLTEVFDVRVGDEFLAAKEMVSLMDVHREKFPSKR